MLGQKKEFPRDFLPELERIEYEESSIDPDAKIYLITWSPDPKEMPDTDFYLQHNLNVKLLSDYLKMCSHGVFCVETTQMGVPHYHGWYQINTEKEHYRIVMIKTMQRFGNVKITPVKKYYKVHDFDEHRNALYYYKKDFIEFNMTPNPIFFDTDTTVNFDVMDITGFFDKRYKSGLFRPLREVISERQFYRDFYFDTVSQLQQ